LAHLNVCSEILDSQIPWVVVVEDHVVTTDVVGFCASVKEFRDKLSGNGPVSVNVNIQAAGELRIQQVPISSQDDCPSTAIEILFLQRYISLATQSDDAVSLMDPHDERVQFTFNKWTQLWQAIWYQRHRKCFKSLRNYLRSLLKNRLYRHTY